MYRSKTSAVQGEDMAAPPLPWRTRLLTGAFSVLANAITGPGGTVIRRFLALIDLKAQPSNHPVDGVSTSDHHVDPARGLWVRLFSPSPSDARSLPVIVYFHGGGFVLQSAASRHYDAFCRRLARQVPALVVSVEYRLSPEHRYPAPYDDGLEVLRWLDAGGGGGILLSDLSLDPPAVFLAGDSAGGNIAHHVARRAVAEKPLERAALAGLVAIQPFFGGEEGTESEARLEGAPLASRELFQWMWRTFLPEGSDRDHEAANVFGPGSATGSDPGEWSGFPEAMVCVGGWDPLQDRQRRYCEGLRGAGVEVRVAEYPNAIHGFCLFPELAEAEQVISDIGDFVRSQLERRRQQIGESQR